MTMVPTEFPDVRTFLLPSRAYLLSFRDQTLPARRAAVADARDYFQQFNDESSHAAQLALLGVMGETLQLVEDVSVLANAFMDGFPGHSFYVKATAYNPRNTNNFYAQAPGRDDDYYLKLATLKIGDVQITDTYRFDPPLDDIDREAIAAGERATAKRLRQHISGLGEDWDRHRQFFHAYKHGALLANPYDVQLVQGHERIPGAVLWRRRRTTAEAGTHITPPFDLHVVHLAKVADVALDVLRYLIETRLRVFDWVRFTGDGSVEQVDATHLPWRFWFIRQDMADKHKRHLEKRFGMQFVSPTESDWNDWGGGDVAPR